MPLLEVRGLQVSYGVFQALFNVDLDLAEGEVVAMIGANGAGKSTFLKALTGLNSEKKGSILFAGKDILNLRADLIARSGISLVPEGRLLFPTLSVEENLQVGASTHRPGPWTLERVYSLFPVLGQLRRYPSHRLSGGQQQMVAIGRSLMSNPRILLCDEVSLGLAPKVINDIYGCFDAIRQEGVSIVLVEQNVVRACSAANRFYCLLEGRVSLSGDPKDYTTDQISAAYFGLKEKA